MEREGAIRREESLPACARCADPDHPAIVEFNQRRGIVGGVHALRDLMSASIEASYPELLDLFCNPQRWLDGRPPWLARDAHRLKASEILIEVVEAPADVDASCVRIKCPHCGKVTSVVVISAGFIAIARNILATSHGTGLTTTDLAWLISDLRQNAKRLRRGPFGYGAGPDLVTPGFAWIASHELAHATQGRLIDAAALGVPAWALEEVQAELDADVTALRALQHRIHATPWAGQASNRLQNLFYGIECVLRASAFVASLRTETHVSVLDQSPIFYDGTPTPGLRLRVVHEERDVLRRLGLLDDDAGNHNPFERWDETASELLDMLI